MLGPFRVWTAHFILVYALASVADISSPAFLPAIRWGAVIASALCGVVLAVLFVRSRGQATSPLARQLAGAGFAFAFIAIGWQTLPLMFSN